MSQFDKVALPFTAFWRLVIVALVAWQHEVVLLLCVVLIFGVIDAGYVVWAHRLLDRAKSGE